MHQTEGRIVMRNPVVVSYTSFRHQLQQQGQMLWFWACAMTTNGMLATSRAQTDPKRSATALMLAMYSVCCLGLDCGAFFCNYNSDKQSLCGVLQCCTAQSSLWMVCRSAGSHMHASIVTAKSDAGHSKFATHMHSSFRWLIQHHVQHDHADSLFTLLLCK